MIYYNILFILFIFKILDNNNNLYNKEWNVKNVKNVW